MGHSMSSNTTMATFEPLGGFSTEVSAQASVLSSSRMEAETTCKQDERFIVEFPFAPGAPAGSAGTLPIY
jgi:hypothetical protein